MYTSYLDDEKKQVLQLYGQRSDDVTPRYDAVITAAAEDILKVVDVKRDFFHVV